MANYKEFTGQEDLEGFYKHVANVLLMNELGGEQLAVHDWSAQRQALTA